MKSNNEDKVNHIVYSYATNFPQLEEENKLLNETISSLKDELNKYKKTPLMVCEVREILADGVIIKIPNGNSFKVNVAEGVSNLLPGDSVLSEQKNLTVVEKLSSTKKFNVEQFVIIEKPDVKWEDIGGLSNQINEIREVIELPLTKPELFIKIGIEPPKGVLLYGEPGTGKTLIAKAAAASTNSTFIEIVGSELVQKFIGEGAKLVKEIFQLAREKAPSIIFIDEIDALAATRLEFGTSGEREVQRTFMQLLAEIDGFNRLGNVKIIGCTNRKDILDPAITRPGRLDRMLKVPLPDIFGRLEILKIHTRKLRMEKDVNLELVNKEMEEFSGAEVHAVCTEAGYFAIREERTKVKMSDFKRAIIKVKAEEELEGSDYLKMFG